MHKAIPVRVVFLTVFAVLCAAAALFVACPAHGSPARLPADPPTAPIVADTRAI